MSEGVKILFPERNVRRSFMIKFIEEAKDTNLEEISLLYSRLHLLFVDIAQVFLRESLKQEGIIIETEKPLIEQAKAALLEIDRVLWQLKTVDKKFKLDNRVLERRYRDELATCQIRIKGMITALNAIWKCGKPSKREVPFGDTTNYRFIIRRMTSYMDTANRISTAINGKAKKFSEANRDLASLPVLQMMTAPSWARNP
jgi:hypothetical protein